MRFPPIAPLGLLFVLSACSSDMALLDQPPETAQSEALATPITDVMPIDLSSKPLLVIEPTVLPEIPPPNLDQLIGQTPAYISAILGDPFFVLRDGNVQTLLFKAAGCILDVGFVEPKSGEPFQANYISARTDEGLKRDSETCMLEIMAEKAAY